MFDAPDAPAAVASCTSALFGDNPVVRRVLRVSSVDGVPPLMARAAAPPIVAPR